MTDPVCVLADPASAGLPLDAFVRALRDCESCRQGPACSEGSVALDQALVRLAGLTRERRRQRSKLRQTENEVELLRSALDKHERRISDLEQLHQVSTKELEAATTAKGQFLANMSHEIRTPMNAVLGMSELLLESSLDERQQEFAETIRTSGSLLLAIINDILDFSKIDAGGLELEREAFELYDSIAGSFALVAEAARAKHLDLAFELAPDTPQIVIGDVYRLQQILTNLLTNAVKFTSSGEVHLTVEVVEPAAVGEHVTLAFAVRDTGVGIPPERTDRLFQAFSQVDASTTREYGGTGLGLTICRQLVERMGGQIEVESTLKVGSTFRFTIQVEVGQLEPAEPRLALESIAGWRALIVDDNHTNRRIVSSLVEGWGVETHSAGSGAHALALLTGPEHFDVALIDYKMPGMDGELLARTIRQLDRRSTLPLILLTSASQLSDPRSNQLFAARLHKPVHPRRLEQALMALGEPESVAGRGPRPRPRARLGQRDRPLRVLVAEDNAVNRRVLDLHLTELGIDAQMVGDGLAAVQQVLSQSFDLVFMDVQMPRLDGLSAIRQICSALASERRPQLVALTAGASAEERQACLGAGADEFLAKPVTRGALEDSLIRAGAAIDAAAANAAAASAATDQSGRALDVLIAEDNLLNQRVARLQLERLGHRCTVVSNGREAVEAGAGGGFDVVLMDCHMPILDGCEATRELRLTPVGRTLPIVALTALSMDGDRQACFDAGMDGYVTKPIDITRLEAEIYRAIESRCEPVVPLWSDEVLASLRGDAAFMAEVTALFASETTRLLAVLREAVEARAADAAERACHELIGASDSIGALRVADRTRQLKHAAARGEFIAAELGLAALAVAVDESLAAQ